MAAALFAFAVLPAAAQESVPASAEPPVAAPASDGIAAGTLVEIRIDEAITSKTHKTGDWYAISLSKPVMLGDRTLVPAGTPGRGQIVHAAKSSWGGKAGELILGARYLELGERRIMLRGMKLGALGGNNEGLAFASSLVLTPLPFVINGKNADVPAGTLATAKLAEPLPASPPEALPAAEPVTATAAPEPAADTSSTTEKGEPKS